MILPEQQHCYTAQREYENPIQMQRIIENYVEENPHLFPTATTLRSRALNASHKSDKLDVETTKTGPVAVERIRITLLKRVSFLLALEITTYWYYVQFTRQ